METNKYSNFSNLKYTKTKITYMQLLQTIYQLLVQSRELTKSSIDILRPLSYVERMRVSSFFWAAAYLQHVSNRRLFNFDLRHPTTRNHTNIDIARFQ